MRIRLAAPAPPAHWTRVFAGIAAGLLVAGRFFPFDRVSIVSCPLRTLAHVPCPTCGMTRAFVRLTHGDLAGALHVSPLGTLLAFACAALVLYTLLRFTILKRSLTLELSASEARGVRVAAVVAIAVNWLYLVVSGAAT